ncbi:MAG: hypothetical protein ACXW0L_03015 [Methylosarcina sp.]
MKYPSLEIIFEGVIAREEPDRRVQGRQRIEPLGMKSRGCLEGFGMSLIRKNEHRLSVPARRMSLDEIRLLNDFLN